MPTSSSTIRLLTLSTCVVDLEAGDVKREGEVSALTPLEAAALRYLSEREGEVVAREDLERDVWGYRGGVESHTVAVCIRRLRSKIEGDPGHPEHLRTVRGQGWVFHGRSAREEDAEAPPEPGDRFVGRRDVLASLGAQIDGHQIVTVLGPAGVGKTRLALELARRLADRFDRVAYLDLTTAHTAMDVCGVLARGLGVRPGSEDPAERLGSALRWSGRALYLLDSCERSADALRELLPSWVDGGQAHFLCCSQVALGVAQERVEPLAPLSMDESVELFLARCPTSVPDAHLSHVHTLVSALDGLPLAIELAAAQVGLLPLPLLEDRLGRAIVEQVTGVLGATLETILPLVSEDARRALGTLAVFADGFEAAAAAAVLGLAFHEAMAVLQELLRTSLLQADPKTSRFVMSASVRARAAGLPSDPEAPRRHRTWFAALEEPGADDLADLEVAVDSARGAGDDTLAVRCALLAAAVYERVGPLRAGFDLLTAAGDDHAPDLEIERRTLLARLSFEAGRTDDALREGLAALALAEADGSASQQGSIHSKLVGWLARVGRLDDAARHADRALALLEPGAEPVALGAARANLALVHVRSDQPAQALTELDAALRLYREAGARSLEARALHNRGVVLVALGRRDEARRTFELGLLRARQAADPASEAVVKLGLAELCYDADELDRSRAIYEDALALQQRLGQRRYVVFTLRCLFNVADRQGRPDDAERFATEVFAVGFDPGDATEEATFRVAFGRSCLLQGRLDEALEHLSRAMSLDVSPLRAQVLHVLGLVHRIRGDLRAARSYLEQAREHARNPPGAEGAGLLASIADLDREQGDHGAARQGYLTAITELRAAGRPGFAACVEADLGGLELQLGDLGAARVHLEGAERVWAERPTVELQGWVFELRARLLAHDGDREGAVAAIDDALAALEKGGHTLDLARVATTRAEISRDAGSLTRARELLDRIGAGPRSPLGTRLAALEP